MAVPEHQSIRVYDREEIQQILHLAIARQAQDRDKEFAYEHIVEIAAELEIPPEAIQLAETEWLAQTSDRQKRQNFNIYKRKKLQKHFGNYVIVNSFLMAINFLSAGTISWALYILLFWGMPLTLKTWNAYKSEGEDYEREFEKWNRRQQVRRSLDSFFKKLLSA
ncbi:MAG: 2TM domain-containing protein [Cyanosarcina radialis HA8281-LM2]|jgi:hypothetical protein|nr:2TM domain-containing protein [Cyanosarcina radialis HA8281-LM2]